MYDLHVGFLPNSKIKRVAGITIHDLDLRPSSKSSLLPTSQCMSLADHQFDHMHVQNETCWWHPIT